MQIEKPGVSPLQTNDVGKKLRAKLERTTSRVDPDSRREQPKDQFTRQFPNKEDGSNEAGETITAPPEPSVSVSKGEGLDITV